MILSDLHNLLKKDFPEIEGLSLPAKDSQVEEIKIHFKEGTSQNIKNAARVFLNMLDLKNLPTKYKREREKAFINELLIVDQLDAIYKYAMLTTAEKEALVPDKRQPADTPAGWLGRVKDIKERFPKPKQ